MPDRRQPPPIHSLTGLRLPAVEKQTLSNGIPVFVVSMGTQEVLRLDLVFLAGRPWEKHRLAARATTALLREGTRQHRGSALAERLDYYGSSLRTPPHLDTAKIILHTPRRYAAEVISLLAEILAEPLFPEEELEAFKKRQQGRLEVDLQKNEVVAYRQLTENLYGSAHPYGYNSTSGMYEALRREWLLEHYRSFFHSGQALIVLSGKVGSKELDLLDRHLGRAIPPGRRISPTLPPMPVPPASAKHLDTGRPGVQTAIRLGRRMFTRHEPDFAGMYLLSAVLGGYFGSRLMQNIREQKGYTYHIYSALDTFLFDGYFYISTEVGHEWVEPTLREIRLELDRLRREPVPEDELQMVRNYLMGTFLSMLDGPFNVADIVKELAIDGLPISFFDDFVEQIRQLNARDLQRLANKYLREEDFFQLMVGSAMG